MRRTRAAADKVRDVDYVDGEARSPAAVAYSWLGKSGDAKREQTIAVAIFKSMMPNGDGKSRGHAYVVISVSEEYELMLARRRRVVHQSLIREADHAWDVLDTSGPDGDSTTFYFQIEGMVAAEAHMLGRH